MADPNTTNSDSGKGIIVMAVDYSNNSEWAFDCEYSLHIPETDIIMYILQRYQMVLLFIWLIYLGPWKQQSMSHYVIGIYNIYRGMHLTF